MYHICTLFDSNYLIRGLTLFRSLQRHSDDIQFYALCLDEKCYQTIKQVGQKNIHPIRLYEIEQWDRRLLDAKKNRSRVEYFFTLSPALPLYLLNTFKNIDIITYMDADLFFYTSPAPIYKALGNHSIQIIEHRFSEHLKDKEIYGRFNVQCQSFRRDKQGISCLEKWHEECIDWCYDRLEDDKFADQKYLDKWPELYPNLSILQHKGAGVAPWNWARYPITQEGNHTFINGDPLIFYHFHAIKILKKCLISHGLTDFGVMPKKLLKWFYKGYIKELCETLGWLESKGISQYDIIDQSIHFRVQNEQSKIQLIKEVFRKAWSQVFWVC